MTCKILAKSFKNKSRYLQLFELKFLNTPIFVFFSLWKNYFKNWCPQVLDKKSGLNSYIFFRVRRHQNGNFSNILFRIWMTSVLKATSFVYKYFFDRDCRTSTLGFFNILWKTNKYKNLKYFFLFFFLFLENIGSRIRRYQNGDFENIFFIFPKTYFFK